jgi:hypothetical protein
MDIVEQQLCSAAYNGTIEEVETLLRDHPDLDINWKDVCGWTALNAASFNGQAKVVKLLLAHPAINVNMQTSFGATSLLLCYSCDINTTFQLLLKDPRVDFTLNDYDGHTLLWFVSFRGEFKIIEMLIASGKDLGDINLKGRNSDDGKVYTALEIARKQRNDIVVSLLERFMTNPSQTRYEIRVKLGFTDALAAEIFTLTIFLCDNLLQFKPPLVTHSTSTTAINATRFFAITRRLLMELQMIMCHRAVGSMNQNILRKDSEPAFKSLTRTLLVL